MDTFSRIKDARKLLNIEEKSSIKEIRENYLKLLKKFHPDTGDGDKDRLREITKDIIDAYNLLMDYCYNYEISFKKEDVERFLKDEEWWFYRFGEDPLWGKAKK
ncbi:hypothetical protein JCM13304A_10860 [Desulfothermus okinawensis JCM 13304]